MSLLDIALAWTTYADSHHLPRPRRAAERLRGLAEGADEGAAHPFGIAESRELRDAFDRFRRGLHALSRHFDAQTLDRLRRRGAGLGDEGAGKMPRAHAGLFGEVFHRQRCIEMFARPDQEFSEAAARRFQFQQRRELRLAAAAAVIEHELARGLLRDLLAKILGHHGERQIDAGSDAGRTPDVAVADEDLVRLQLHLGIGGKKMRCTPPMRGGAAAVEQAGFGKDVGAGADAGDADAALCQFPHERERLRADRRPPRALASRDNQG